MSETFSFPPVKEIFLADPHHTLVEIDLAGADARVLAWRAKDPKLKAAFLKGLKIHKFNGETIWGADAMAKDLNKILYHKAKKGVHATNYGAKPPALIKRCGMTPPEANNFQRIWFAEHPAITEWHDEIKFLLNSTRTLHNPFGYRQIYFDRPANCFTNALAWEPSSVVAEVTFIAMRRIDRQYRGLIQLLLQVHDSLLLQIPTQRLQSSLASLYGMLNEIVIPYEDPLVIPWELKLSAKSWGHCKEIAWTEV